MTREQHGTLSGMAAGAGTKMNPTPRRRIIKRMSRFPGKHTVLLECGHWDTADWRNTSCLCFECHYGKPVNYLAYGISEAEFQAWKSVTCPITWRSK